MWVLGCYVKSNSNRQSDTNKFSLPMEILRTMQEGITILDGTTSEDHMKEDLEVVAVDRFELSPNDMSDIRALLQPKATSGRPKGRQKPATNGTVRKTGRTIRKDGSDRVGRRTRGRRETRRSR